MARAEWYALPWNVRPARTGRRFGGRALAMKGRKSGGVRGRARLGAALLRRPAVLGTLLLDRIRPEPEPPASADFHLWLRFVLTQDEAAQFLRWSHADGAAYRDLEKRFIEAIDDADLETLLQRTRSALAATSKLAPERGRAARNSQ